MHSKTHFFKNLTRTKIAPSRFYQASRLSALVALLIFLTAPPLYAQYAQKYAQNDHFDQLPDLGSQAANFLSDGEAEKLGKAFIRQSRYRQPYVSDPELVNYINNLGQKLLAVSPDAGKNYQFYLIDNHIINAFAVPGGHIALHTAILTKSETESELASVVAHEISHVAQRHIARKLETSKYDSWIALGALLAAAAAGGSDAAQAAFGLANASIIDRQLHYSRSFEAEADSHGIRLLSHAGFKPSAMPVFFKRLLDESRLNKSSAPEFLRSHPLTINRIAESAERVRAYPEGPDRDEFDFQMMRAKATSAYAKNKSVARDHYKNLISLGDDSLPTRYGYALALSENAEYEEARKQFKQLLIKHPDNITLKLGQAENEQYANKVDESLRLFKALYEEQTAKGNHIVDIYYANALVLVKRHETAIPILRSAIANNRNEPYFHHLLSRAYGETGDNFRSFQERGEYHYLRGNYEFALKQFQRAKTFTDSDYELARIGARIDDVEMEIEAIKNL